jgi:signal transduction histidine kinase
LTKHAELFTEEERQLLEMIYHGGARLNEIVNDLLQVAKLEANTIAITKKPLHLNEILGFLLQEIAPRLEVRKQKIMLHDLHTLPYFNGDREYLMEVFMELLENAMKFTPDAGEITISAWVTDRSRLEGKQHLLERFHNSFYRQMGVNSYIHVEIRDSGIGIALEDQYKVFDKFYAVGDIRHHSSGKLKFQGKGAGLGLTIVKGMIEAHGGMIWVESHAQQGSTCNGSTFSLLLPLEDRVSQPSFPFMQPR